MESLADSDSEQGKKTAVFYGNSPSSPKKNIPRSQTPDLSKRRKERSPDSPLLHSMPALDGLGQTTDSYLSQSPLGSPREKNNSLSRVSYEGSSKSNNQVRYMGGFGSLRNNGKNGKTGQSGDDVNELSPVRLLPLDHSPTLPRRRSEPRVRQRDVAQPRVDSTETDNIQQGLFKNQAAGYSPASSPGSRRRSSDLLNGSPLFYSQSAESSPDFPHKQQKKTAVVSPLLDVNESRPRSVPPDLLMFDPTDPESPRFEQVRQKKGIRVVGVVWNRKVIMGRCGGRTGRSGLGGGGRKKGLLFESLDLDFTDVTSHAKTKR